MFPFRQHRRPPAEREAVEPVVVLLRIAILHLDKDVWCDMCGVPCAVTVI
ncbi:hypothetical protein ACWDKQ_13150 [Saccharopolyspora sp. NPDC000995]